MGDTLRLADDLFLVALDEQTGRHIVHTRTLGVALAGALLSELVLPSCINVVGDRLKRAAVPPPDALTHDIAETIDAEPHHQLATWIAFLATDATDRIADRLVRTRHITKVASRARLRTPTMTYAAASTMGTAWRAVRLTTLLQAGHIDQLQDAVLVAICHAIGLTGHLWRDTRQPNREHLDWILRKLAETRPDLHHLVTCVSATAGAQAFTPR